MRLTHLKLAGFKSFADPTTLHIHGQRIGIVGPNGCGKSNVMEAIRWVLGESSAREMRGDSMNDVIFNGSSHRKPVSRASVELLFDNSLGGASGAWSQYAEISVKRVLQRDGGSTYYINNTQVRRRDVADLFLGTGLGSRAYAIIGQNTISRIVEAKPEDLRVFLEEAAGISKYKERRRETELRLRDTRDNLTRVEDIRRELASQIKRLEAQAAVAQQYHSLRAQLALTNAQVWLMKKRDAAQNWEKSQRQVERLINDLESQTAELRKSESMLEQLRLQYQESSSGLQLAQGRFYAANARVSELEQQIRHAQQTRERIVQQLSQLQAELQKAEIQRAETVAQLAQQHRALGHVQEALQQARQAQENARQALPGAEQVAREGQAAFGQLQNAIIQAEQAVQLERTHAAHARKSLEALHLRQQRLTEDMHRLVLPDSDVLATQSAEHAALQQRLTVLEEELQHMIDTERRQAEMLRVRQQEAQQEQHRLARHEAQLAALRKLQAALGHESKLEAWLQQHGIADARRLWQCLTVEPGYETALEGLLGNRLNAVVAELPPPFQRPPAALVIAQAGGDAMSSRLHAQGWRPLHAVVACHESTLHGLFQEWLGQAWLLEASADPETARQHLAPGEVLVTRDGDVYTRHSVSFYAAQSGLHGVLERQRELTQLEESLPAMREAMRVKQVELQDAERQLQEIRKQIAHQQQMLRQETARMHALGLEVQRTQQQFEHALERRRHLEADLTQLAKQKHDIETHLREHEMRIENLLASLADYRTQHAQAARIQQEREQALHIARERLRDAERQVQQQEFSEKIIINKISELESKLNILNENIASLSGHCQELNSQLSSTDDIALKLALAEALECQHKEEQALLQAREQFAALEQSLQEGERHRLQSEQQLSPIRDRLEQARLAEQEARLYFEQCAHALRLSGYEEANLAQQLARGISIATLERRVEDLEHQISELGAVNLAAIQELASARERETYLDSQCSDLNEAVATLEEAIRRIDRETRTRLQQTYEAANQHFGELFMTLFGGGQARLQLLGDEILDTGVQVFAQPPGKKNSTIHLLSGGEKALTALALVFALFRLNPAPFCLLDEVDAPLDDSNVERFCTLVRKMSERTQFLFVSHNKITMEMAQQLVGVTMQESGVSRIVEVDVEAAMQMQTELAL